MSAPVRALRTNERDELAVRAVRLKDEQTLANLRRGSLSWQVTVNGILLAAGYHSDEMGLLSTADLMRMDEAFAMGQSPEQFAASVMGGAS